MTASARLALDDTAQSLHPDAVHVLDSVLAEKPPIHFVGIGGAGMSALALGMHHHGFTVTGSDINDSANVKQLQAQGIIVSIAHDAAHVMPKAVVVVSTAIDPKNPEIAIAQDREQVILHRSQILQALMHSKTVGAPMTVGLTGTHGKTTLTGMMDAVLQVGQIEATAIAGGKLPGLNQNIRLSNDHNICVAELDESDGTILRYAPTYTILANLELDHADHYTDGLSALIETFKTFGNTLNSIPTPEGHTQTLVMNGQCENSVALASHLPDSVRRYWLFDNERGAQAFDCRVGTDKVFYIHKVGDDPLDQHRVELIEIWDHSFPKRIGKFSLLVPGWHNVWNAAMVAIVAMQLDIKWSDIAKGLHDFTGMGRRFERIGTFNEATLVDDYAHHPTEVMVTLKAARERMKELGLHGQLVACFQPHRYTRLQAFWDDFCDAFLEADIAYILETYSAHEDPIKGIDSAHFVKAMQAKHSKMAIFHTPDMEGLRETLRESSKKGDMIISMGAGTVTRLLREGLD